jgi:hypothetical protein
VRAFVLLRERGEKHLILLRLTLTQIVKRKPASVLGTFSHLYVCVSVRERGHIMLILLGFWLCVSVQSN